MDDGWSKSGSMKNSPTTDVEDTSNLEIYFIGVQIIDASQTVTKCRNYKDINSSSMRHGRFVADRAVPRCNW